MAHQQELFDLLRSWEVEEEYMLNFEREKVQRISTLKLLDVNSIEKLIPHAGPRLDFMARLDEFKKPTKENNIIVVETLDLSTVPIITAEGPALIPKANNNQENQDFNSTKRPPNQDLVSIDGDQTEENENGKSLHPPAKKPRTTGDGPLQILMDCVDGQFVLAYHNVHNELDEVHRNILADVLISHFLKADLGKILTKAEEDKIWEYIADLFPSESKAVWLGDSTVSRELALGRGKLLNRYYNVRRKLIKLKLIQPASAQSKSSQSDHVDEMSDVDLAAVNDCLAWLQNSKHPWGQVIDYWQKTSSVRYSSLKTDGIAVHKYMDTYPALKEPQGYILLDTDFGVLHEGAGMKLYTEWPMLAAFIASKLPHQDKEIIEESLTPDAKKLRTILSVNKLFPVLTVKRVNKNVAWRPSRIESRDGLFQLVKTEGDIKTTLANRREKYAMYGLKLGPQAVAVGPDEDSIRQCYVCINDIIYAVESPLKVIDIVFKAAHALDTLYQEECKREWLFLQRAVYGVATSYDKKILDVKTKKLIEDYNTFKSSN